ncbi:MAG: histidine kinase [Chitinophagaceae bacterium]|nr:histidine kinase [Chitinophagaceae bacterium]
MKAMSIARKYGLYHILFWLTLFATWHFFRYQDYPESYRLHITAIKVADLALLVYLTNYLLIPKLLYRKRYWLFGGVFLAMVIASSILKMYVLGRMLQNPAMFSLAGNLKERIYDNVLPHILLVCTGAAFKLLADQLRAQRRLVDMAREKANAELNFLKSQINPHLLFNSLNSIYFLIDKSNAEARKTLLQFSDLLRYQLYECGADRIEIEKELRFLKDYLHLQALRKDSNYEIKMDVSEEVRGFTITPLLLIPFVENAFKHISHHGDRTNFVHVSMSRMNGTLNFNVSNSKDEHQRITEPTGGIGLTNVKRRLELIYPGQHQLAIENASSTFHVSLSLDINRPAITMNQ